MAIGSSEFNSYGGGGWGGGFGGPFMGGGGAGFGGLGLFGLVGLLGARGLGGHDGGCGESRRGGGSECWDLGILSKLGTIEAAIPVSTAAINANTMGASQSIKDNLVSLASGTNQAFQTQLLATLQGINTTKDSITVSAAASAAQTNEITNLIAATTCSIKNLVLEDGDRTRALITANRIGELQDQLAEERHGRRSRENEINVTQVVNQNQAQLQQQQQQQQQFQLINDNFHRLNCRFGAVEAIQNQLAKQQMGSAVNFGSGSQTYTPTQANNQVGGQL